ncbi:MAG: hypothetical protein V2A78_13875 [bacterium]
MNKTRTGFTISEVMVAAVVFLLFSTSVISVLTLGMNYLQVGQVKILAQGNARAAADCITSELKQAILNPNSVTGYPGISPAILPSAVLCPNSNTRTAGSITFTEPNPANYTPYTTGWNYENAANYQTVRYYVSNRTVYREMKRFDADGNQISITNDPIAQTPGGTITLSFTYVSSQLFTVTVTSSEVDSQNVLRTYTISPTVAVLGL